MPVAARIPQASNPINDLLIRDFLSIDDKIADVKSYRSISVVDMLDIETILVATGHVTSVSTLTELDIETELAHFNLTPIYVVDSLGIDVYQNYTEQYEPFIPVEPIDPGDSTGRIENFEHDFALSTIYADYFKEFHYSGDVLNGYTIYSNVDKSVALFTVEFVYSSGTLIEKNITRNSDGRVLTITYQYQGSILVGLIRTIA